MLGVTSTEEVVCNLQRQWSRAQTANAATQFEAWNLYLPPGVALGGQDRVTVDGVGKLEVFGPGGGFADFERRPHHTEATVRRVR